MNEWGVNKSTKTYSETQTKKTNKTRNKPVQLGQQTQEQPRQPDIVTGLSRTIRYDRLTVADEMTSLI